MLSKKQLLRKTFLSRISRLKTSKHTLNDLLAADALLRYRTTFLESNKYEYESDNETQAISDGELSSKSKKIGDSEWNHHINAALYSCYKRPSGSEKIEKDIAKKSVTFVEDVRVKWIPSRIEYACFAADLWWTADECKCFRNESFNEIKEYLELNHHRYFSVKEAIFMMYQVNDETKTLLNQVNFCDSKTLTKSLEINELAMLNVISPRREFNRVESHVPMDLEI